MSFTEIILKNNNLEKTCHSCGQHTVYYKKRLRITTIDALCFIKRQYSDKVFSNTELKIDLYNNFGPLKATELFKHYALAIHFGLLNGGKKYYFISELGKLFIQGLEPVPEYIYGNRHGHFSAQEIGLKPAPMLFITDFTFADESDAKVHYDEAVPIPQF